MKITFYVAVGLAGLALGGCGYKPLNAPCSMEDGGGPAQSSKLEIAPTAPVAPADAPIQALSYAGAQPSPALGPFQSVRGGDCGPLRPINARTLR
jgi:hypothetical protein